jgi:hypothetical protein
VRSSAVVLVAAAAGAGDSEVCGAGVDVGDVGVGEADIDRGNVLAKTVDLAGAGDGHNARGLGEQPSERDLARSDTGAGGDLFDQINDGLVGGKGFRG